MKLCKKEVSTIKSFVNIIIAIGTAWLAMEKYFIGSISFCLGCILVVYWFNIHRTKDPPPKILKFFSVLYLIIFLLIFYAGKLFNKAQSTDDLKSIAINNGEILKEEKNKIKTLHDLFLSDFNKTHMISEHRVIINKNIIYTIKYIIWGDFDTKSIYFSIFLPKSDYTYDACRFLIPKYKEILNGNIKSLMEAMIHNSPGAKEESWAELQFTGRVYIYHETRLLQKRIDFLMQEYKREGLSPQFRGREYLIMKNSPLYKE